MSKGRGRRMMAARRSEQGSPPETTVLFPFVGDSVGGSHMSALALIEQLPDCGVRAVVGLHHDDGPLAGYLADRGIPHVELPRRSVVSGAGMIREPLRMLRHGMTLGRWLCRQPFDVVHTNDARMHLSWSPAARLGGIRHVWHQRTINPSRRLGLYACLPARILTISQFCRSGLPPAMARRAQVVDEPFDPFEPGEDDRGRHRAAVVAELGIPHSVPLVGFVGNMEAQKRPSVFLDMAARLADTDAHFVMVGDPRGFLETAEGRRIGRDVLAGRIHVTGPQFPILPWLAAFDVLVAPGVNEGLGRTLVEAMFAGTPVVAADDGGHREIVNSGENGELARPDDADDFAVKMRLLLDSPDLRRKLSLRGRESVRERFAAARHARTVAGIYGELASDIRH
jgi:glycosyltransferase involved in cell wall biosynthesis